MHADAMHKKKHRGHYFLIPCPSRLPQSMGIYHMSIFSGLQHRDGLAAKPPLPSQGPGQIHNKSFGAARASAQTFTSIQWSGRLTCYYFIIFITLLLVLYIIYY